MSIYTIDVGHNFVEAWAIEDPSIGFQKRLTMRKKLQEMIWIVDR
jgi:hypothetical protein